MVNYEFKQVCLLTSAFEKRIIIQNCSILLNIHITTMEHGK